ncbi:hypothetical protein ACWGKU_20075 [Kitasatospora sp. NPDC054768]
MTVTNRITLAGARLVLPGGVVDGDLDLTGSTVVPGFVDLHVHVALSCEPMVRATVPVERLVRCAHRSPVGGRPGRLTTSKGRWPAASSASAATRTAPASTPGSAARRRPPPSA